MGQDVCTARKANGYSAVIETITFSPQAPQTGAARSGTIFLLLKGSYLFQRIMPLMVLTSRPCPPRSCATSSGRRESSQRPTGSPLAGSWH